MGDLVAHLSADAYTSVINRGVRTKILANIEGPLAGRSLMDRPAQLTFAGQQAYRDDQSLVAGPWRLTLRSEPPLPQREIVAVLGGSYTGGIGRQSQFDFSQTLSTDVFGALKRFPGRGLAAAGGK